MSNHWLKNTITTTFYGIDTGNTNWELWGVLCKCLAQWEKGEELKTYGSGILKLYDGSGLLLEEWHLKKLIAKSVSFGDLCCYGYEEDELEIKWQYDSATWINKPPSIPDLCHDAYLPPTTTAAKINAATPGLGMGMGRIGTENIVFKRKWRWTFECEFGGKKISPHFVKVSARPETTLPPDDGSHDSLQ
jgi:hypothetical protein